MPRTKPVTGLPSALEKSIVTTSSSLTMPCPLRWYTFVHRIRDCANIRIRHSHHFILRVIQSVASSLCHAPNGQEKSGIILISSYPLYIFPFCINISYKLGTSGGVTVTRRVVQRTGAVLPWRRATLFHKRVYCGVAASHKSGLDKANKCDIIII